MKTGTIVFTILFSLVITNSFAGFEQKDQGARSAGLADAMVARGFSSWCLYSNPAGLATLTVPELNVSAFRPFGLKELQTGSLAFGLSAGESAYGFGATYSGQKPYSETQFVFGYARRVTEFLNAGASLNFHQVSIENYGSASVFSLDAGILVRPFKGIQAGISVFNLGRSSIGKSNEPLPSGWRTGVSAWIEQRLLISGEWYQQAGYQPDFRFGLEFPVHDYVTLRTGLSTAPSQVTLGTGFTISGFGFDYAFKNHPDLGVSHQFSVVYSFSGQPGQTYPTDYFDWGATESLLKPEKKQYQKQSSPIPLNLNEASVSDLKTLPGISTELAERIVELRDKKGRFVSMDELLSVPGMTESRISKLKPYLFILESPPENP